MKIRETTVSGSPRFELPAALTAVGTIGARPMPTSPKPTMPAGAPWTSSARAKRAEAARSKASEAGRRAVDEQREREPGSGQHAERAGQPHRAEPHRQPVARQ